MKLNKTFIILIILFICALLFRTYLIQQNLFFGPEQGIDFMAIRKIAVDHNLTLIGSKTDVSGIFHGPVYYYLAVIPFLVSNGDPLIISIFLIILNTISVFLVYYLTKILAGKRAGLIAAVLFTFSFLSIVYPRWLSSPPLSIPLVLLFFVFFYRFVQGSGRSLIFAAISLGLLNQAEFLNIIFFSVISIFLVILFFSNFKRTKGVYIVLSGALALVITFGTYILFDIRHDFLISKSLLALAIGSSGYHVSFFQTILETWNSLIRVYQKTIFPLGTAGSIALFLFALMLILQKCFKKDKLFYPLLIWLLIPIILLIILRHNILDHFFVSLIPLFIILTAVAVEFVWKKKKNAGQILLIVLVSVNLYFWWKNIPVNQEIFFQSTQPALRYSDQLSTIDEIYKQAENKDFSFQSYTIPYWTQDGWRYLFKTYGAGKYGYAPIEQKAKKLFVIIQDDPSNSAFQKDWLEKTVSTWGKPIGKFKRGILTTLELKTEAK